jgi:solute carrier family 25 (mitochondrial citrate transporter), member 1
MFTITGLQKSPAEPGQSAWSRISAISTAMYREEGARAFYKGITPRVLRVAPGQAVAFAVYERVRKLIENIQEAKEPMKMGMR